MKNPSTDFENLLFTTVRINTTYLDGNGSSGTGFFISCDLQNGNKDIFLVTNKHVIDDGVNWKLLFNESDDKDGRGKPIFGEHIGADIGNATDCWIKHETYDVTILNFNSIYNILRKNEKPPFIRTINYKKIPSEIDINEKIDAIEDIYLIGYPNALYDPISLIPIVRRGITATPFSVDFMGQSQFLIDASVFPGSSGSPVIICDRNLEYKKGGWNNDARTYLLGILSGGHFRTDSDEMIDLGIVYKSSVIKEMIDEVLKSNKHSLA